MGAMPSQVKHLYVHSDTGGAGKAIPYLSLPSTAKNLKPQRARRTSAEGAEKKLKKLMTAKDAKKAFRPGQGRMHTRYSHHAIRVLPMEQKFQERISVENRGTEAL